jgi:hypothetical protein
MKTSKAFRFFLITAIASALMSVIMYFYNKEAMLDFTVFDLSIHSSYATVWEIFSIYLFVLSLIYLIIDNSSLQPNRWLVTSHFVFVISFLLVFMGFSLFDTTGFRILISVYQIPTITVFVIYAFLLVTDLVLFLLGLIFLLLNLLSLHKEKR